MQLLAFRRPLSIMSGGEIAGLALGAIALASLFQTCVEMFDYLETAKNCIEDQRLASLKVGLLRERLRTWGDDLNILIPGEEDWVLRECWPLKSEAVIKSLLKLKSSLSDSDILIQRYKSAKSSKNSVRLRQRALWAVHDRNKLDRYIQDISFLIDNLEAIVSRTRLPYRRSQHWYCKKGHTQSTTSQLAEESPMPTGPASTTILKPLDISIDDKIIMTNQQASHASQGADEIKGNNSKTENYDFSYIGTVGKSGKSTVSENTQELKGRSFGFIGTTSDAAFKGMHEREIKREQSSKENSGSSESKDSL